MKKSMHGGREMPHMGDIYRHFKGQTYRVIGYVKIANDNAVSKPMVLYQAVNPIDFRAINLDYFCRDLDEFLSPVDKDKYPHAKQEWRFEKSRCCVNENH